MSDILSHTATVFMGLFAIMNPIANTPVFIGLTSDDDQATKKAIAFKSTSLAFLIVMVFCLSGKLIFEVTGLSYYWRSSCPFSWISHAPWKSVTST